MSIWLTLLYPGGGGIFKINKQPLAITKMYGLCFLYIIVAFLFVVFKYNENVLNNQSSSSVIRPNDAYTNVRIIDKTDKTLSVYTPLENKLLELELYEPFHIGMFEPESRYKRRHWLTNLKLKFPVAMMTRQYGGNIGNVKYNVESA